MMKKWIGFALLIAFGIALITIAQYHSAIADEVSTPNLVMNGIGDGWIELGESDFENVNCDPDTWSWKNGMLHCKGTPIGVLRSKKVYTNFEIVVEWNHQKSAGNSGLFIWAPMHALENMKRDSLPGYGIEVQMLDHGYKEQYEKSSGKPGDWFSTNGDIFPVGKSTLNPFPPLSPSGERSFPSKNLSKGFGNWNHYYVRAINGEVRLWVNGEEVSGGSNAEPRAGHFCLESEGSPIVFKNIRIRELP